MSSVARLLTHLTIEHLSWFGAGLSAAALGVVGYQFVFATVLAGPLPGLQPSATPYVPPRPSPTRTPRPTSTPYATSTPRPSATPHPTSTPRPTATTRPTSTPRPKSTPLPQDAPDLIATMTIGDPAGLAAAVATLVARTAAAVQALPTPMKP